MKKTLKILASAVLAASMLFAMSCSKDVEPTVSAEDTKSWYGQLKSEHPGCIDIEQDPIQVSWWAITNRQNVVLADSINNKGLEKTIAGDTNHKDTLRIDLNTVIDPKKDTEIVLWINQSGLTSEQNDDIKKNPTYTTFLGSLTLKKGEGIAIKASKYRTATTPVCILPITCNETNPKGPATNTATGVALVKHNWHGNYRINEVAPLRLQEGKTDEWIKVGGLHATNFGNIDEGCTKKFIWPAENTLVGIVQNDRFDSSKAAEDDKANEDSAKGLQRSWFWTQAKNCTGKAYTEVSGVSSNDSDLAVPGGLGKPEDKSKEKGGQRSALTPVIVNEADFIPAGDLK